jgi:alpha-L-rhamnosidase
MSTAQDTAAAVELDAATNGLRIAEVWAGRRRDGGPVDTATPSLSWIVDTDIVGWHQAGVEIANGPTIAQVSGDESSYLTWPFAPLAPRERASLRVRVTGVDGTRSPWSDPVEVWSAHLEPEEWVADFIGLAHPDTRAQPAQLRRTFVVPEGFTRATLYATAQGVYRITVNGVDSSDAEMSPGWTTYQHRLLYDVVDVSDLLVSGANRLAADLAGGWYTEEYGFDGDTHAIYGDQPALSAQLVIEFADGGTSVIATDEDWEITGEGPLRSSSIYQGETYDARRRTDDWAGQRPAVRSATAVALVPRASEPVRVTETLPALSTLRTPSGELVVDFGQNLVGRVRLRVRGEAGTSIRIRHAEVLENGELGTRPLRGAAATDHLILMGGGDIEVWEPSFTFHGFRYVELSGWPGEFEADSIEALVMHSDMRRTGWFETDNELVQKLHDNVVWGLRGNFFSIPTDCPQRDERMGWTGDIQVFAPTASFLYDCNAFLTSWLADLALEQGDQGGIVPYVVPDVFPQEAHAAAAWGDAATIVPSVLRERFGDTTVLASQYVSMRSWADTIAEIAGDALLWTEMPQFGDWLDPDSPPDNPYAAKTPPDLVATAYLYHSTRLVAEAATVLGLHPDDVDYEQRARRIRSAFRRTFIDDSGRMSSHSPTAYALALRFGLADEDERAEMGRNLADLVRESGYRIGTGFVGTPLIQDALTETGHLEVAGRLLLQTESPSWLYAVTMGATTIWERWDSMLPDGSINPGEMTSFNHYAFGAIADWLHRVVGGLAPAEPGYRHLQIRPHPIEGIGHARTAHLTPYGLASVEWTLDDDGRFTLDLEVPASSVATVHLPDGSEPMTVSCGRHRWSVDVKPQHWSTTQPIDREEHHDNDV